MCKIEADMPALATETFEIVVGGESIRLPLLALEALADDIDLAVGALVMAERCVEPLARFFSAISESGWRLGRHRRSRT